MSIEATYNPTTSTIHSGLEKTTMEMDNEAFCMTT